MRGHVGGGGHGGARARAGFEEGRVPSLKLNLTPLLYTSPPITRRPHSKREPQYLCRVEYEEDDEIQMCVSVRVSVCDICDADPTKRCRNGTCGVASIKGAKIYFTKEVLLEAADELVPVSKAECCWTTGQPTGAIGAWTTGTLVVQDEKLHLRTSSLAALREVTACCQVRVEGQEF